MGFVNAMYLKRVFQLRPKPAESVCNISSDQNNQAYAHVVLPMLAVRLDFFTGTLSKRTEKEYSAFMDTSLIVY
jgi:hypothetical protein